MGRAKSATLRLLSVFALALAVTACDEPVGVDDPNQTGRETGTLVRILLTDAPSDYIGSAWVDIGEVELISADGEHVMLSEDGTDGFVDLLDFQGPATTPIAEAEIDPGSFVQLRLVVEAARVELIEGYTFRDGSTEMDLFVPSGAQTGIKLNLHDIDDEGPVDITPGETVLVLDFDVNKSFVLRGNPETPAGVHGVNFTPSIRVVARDVAASISGTVTTSVEGLSVEGMVVVADPVDAGDAPGYQSWSGSALVAEDGTYTIHFLVPGDYTVTVETPPGLAPDPETRSVDLGEAENETGVDFDIIDITGSIAGTVTTSFEGATVEGLTVTATPDDETIAPVEATTAADGTYLLDGLIPATYVVTVDPGDDLVTDPESHEVPVGNQEDVVGIDFEVLEDVTGTISGVVTTAVTGVSVEGLIVTATPDAAGAEPLTATVAADGTYTIVSVPPGNYTVTVAVGDGQVTDPASRSVEITENEEETGVNFTVIASGQ